MRKLYLVAAVGLVLIAAGFFALNSYIYKAKQADETMYELYRATLRGEYLCLPHRDQSGPQTDECATGIKTDVGEYFAIDFNLISQPYTEPMVGETLTASGVVTPVERLSASHWQQYPIEGIFSVTDSLVIEMNGTEIYECDADAMICPDGSSVGRTGSDCEFAACPSPDATSGTVMTYLGGTATAQNISVNPIKIVSDSRCPSTVTCIWAGTVEVRTVLSTAVAHGEHVLTLGEPQIFGDHTVTLTTVTPEKTEADIPESSYRFTFEIKKR